MKHFRQYYSYCNELSLMNGATFVSNSNMLWLMSKSITRWDNFHDWNFCRSSLYCLDWKMGIKRGRSSKPYCAFKLRKPRLMSILQIVSCWYNRPYQPYSNAWLFGWKIDVEKRKTHVCYRHKMKITLTFPTIRSFQY